MKKFIAPLCWIIAFEIISAGIGYYTNSDMTWYSALQKSPLTPPGYMFPIVWTALYAMIALAGYFIWHNRHKPHGQTAFYLFTAYMVLNWLWSFVFFTAHMLAGALIVIGIINILAVLFIVRAWQPSRISSILMIPSLCWTGFASYLAYMVWHLN